MNAVVYCRVSTTEQVQNLSLGTQQTRCIEHCTRNSWPVLRVFRDEGKSAKTTDRTAFQEMLRFSITKQNAVSFVVVHDQSRFSRDLADQAGVMAQLEAAGVRVRSVMENVDETAAGKLMRNIYGSFNQFENDRKAERTKLGMQRAAQLGRFPFKAPLGYLNVNSKTSENLVPDPDRAPIIKKMFELFATGTHTKMEVLKAVTGLGLRTQGGQTLSPQTLQNLLRNPIYAGWVVIPSWNVREHGSFSPLVSDDLFERVQDLLTGRRPSITAYERNRPDFPLRVFVRCGVCDTPLTGGWSKGRSKHYAYYKCRTKSCKSVNVKRDKLDQGFADLLERLTPENRYLRLFQEIVRDAWKEKQSLTLAILAAATKRLSELQERKDRLVETSYSEADSIKKPTTSRLCASKTKSPERKRRSERRTSTIWMSKPCWNSQSTL